MFLARESRDVEEKKGTFEWQGDRIVVLDVETNQEQWSWSTFDYYSTEDYDIYHPNYRAATDAWKCCLWTILPLMRCIFRSRHLSLVSQKLIGEQKK